MRYVNVIVYMPHFKLFMIEITVGVAFLLSSMYSSSNQNSNTSSVINTNGVLDKKVSIEISYDRKSVENYLRQKYADTPILVDVARCESTFSQFDKDGNVVRGKANRDDVGVMQINEKYHSDTAKKLGYDLHTIEGNTTYAKHLYEEQGLAPWKYSSKCWGATNRDLTINR